MNVLQVNNVDLIGRRFNGYDLCVALRRDGNSAYQIVTHKISNDENVIDLSQIVSNFIQIRNEAYRQEYLLSMPGMLYPFGHDIENNEKFLDSDIVHYHLIYNGMISLAEFAKLTHKKPSVITIHDCFLLTGHCIYTMDCDKYMTGCLNCPDLNSEFPIKDDNTAQMWAVKKLVFKEAALEIITGSKWMYDMIQKSPILSHLKTHFIQFGIDVEFFMKPRENVREKYGIPKDAFVLFFRSAQHFKGTDHIKTALELMDKKPYLIVCGIKNSFEDYPGIVLDKGFITDDDEMADLFAACDVFLMPSTAESFGFMAVECMASGKPIIVADGTALPGVTFSPECGISVPQGDANALKHAIERLRDNPEEREKRGLMGQKLALEHYRFEDYYTKHKELYFELMKKKQENRNN